MHQPGKGEGKSLVDLRALSDEDLPSEGEEDARNSTSTANLKRPLLRPVASGLRKGSPANHKNDRKEPATKKRRVEQTPSPHRTPQSSRAPRSGSSPTSSPFSSSSSNLPPSKLLLALSSLPNAKRISKLLGADSGTTFDEWPNRLTSPTSSNIPSTRQRKYVLHFVSLWENLLALSEDDPSRQFFATDLQVILKSHYPCDQRTILDQVLATFLLFHPEHVSSVLSALIDLLSPPAPSSTAFAPNSPFELASIKNKKRVLSYNKKNIPFSNLLGLFTACREEEGGFYYRPSEGQEEERKEDKLEERVTIPLVEGGSPALLVCSEIARFLITSCYPDEAHLHEDILHPSRKICAWLTDCLIEGPAVLREEHFNSILSQIDGRELSGVKKGPVVLLKELVFQEHNKYHTLTLAASLLPLLLSRHQRFMQAQRSFSLTLSEQKAIPEQKSKRNLSPSVAGYLLPFRAVFKAYFSQPARVQSQQFVYQLLRSPPLHLASSASLEESHVIFPLFELLVTLFSSTPAASKKKAKKKKEEKELEADSFNIHAWFTNHFLDPILEILSGEDGIGIPQAKLLLKKVFFNKAYSSLLFGKDEEYETGEPKTDVTSSTPPKGDEREKGTEPQRARSGSLDDASVNFTSTAQHADTDERERLRLRMMLMILDVMRNYGKDVQNILMDTWEQSWTSPTPIPSALDATSPKSNPQGLPSLLSLHSIPSLDLSCLSSGISSSTEAKVAAVPLVPHLSWERLKALLALYRVLSPDLQAMARRIFISFLDRLGRQRKESATNEKHVQQVYQMIVHFFFSEGKRGFSQLFIDFVDFICAVEGPEIARSVSLAISRLFAVLTLDVLAIRTHDHPLGTMDGNRAPNATTLSSLGVFATAYRAEILSSLLRAKPSASAFAHLKSPFKSRKPGAAGASKAHSQSYLEACGDEPSKTKAAALLIVDTLEGFNNLKASSHFPSREGIKEEKQTASKMEIDEDIEAEADAGGVALETVSTVEREFFAANFVSRPSVNGSEKRTRSNEEIQATVLGYLRTALLSKGFLDYLFKGLAPAHDAESRAIVIQLLLLLAKIAKESSLGPKVFPKENQTKEPTTMEIDSAPIKVEEERREGRVMDNLYLSEFWRDKRNLGILLDLLADPYPQTADKTEDYIKILLEGARVAVGGQTRKERLPPFILLMLEGLWERVIECVDHEGAGRRCVAVLGQIAYNWPILKKDMVKKIDSSLLLRGGKHTKTFQLQRQEHCWPNPALLALLRDLNNDLYLSGLEEDEVPVGGIVNEQVLEKAMLGILENNKHVQLRQYELLASCIEKGSERGEMRKMRDADGQLRFFVGHLPAVIQGLCSPFTEVKEICFMILKKALEVPVQKEQQKENEKEQEREKGKEKDEDLWKWKGVNKEGEVLVARIDDADLKKNSALAEHVAELFDKKVKMQLIIGTDPTTLHTLQEAQRRLQLL